MTVKDYSTRTRVRSFLVCVITCGIHVTDICRETFFYRGESTTQNMLSLTCTHIPPGHHGCPRELNVLKSQSFCGCTPRSKYVQQTHQSSVINHSNTDRVNHQVFTACASVDFG